LFLKTLTGEVRLPTAEGMNEDTEKERKEKKAKGFPDRSKLLLHDIVPTFNFYNSNV
jgi:hypothetical protein